MIDRLYVARGDETFGPFSAARLRELAATGRLRLTDTVWRHGAMERSVFASKVKNLFPSPQDQAAGGPLPSPMKRVSRLPPQRPAAPPLRAPPRPPHRSRPPGTPRLRPALPTQVPRAKWSPRRKRLVRRRNPSGSGERSR